MTQTHIPSFIHFFLKKTQEWKDCYVHRNIGIRGSNAKYETGMKELTVLFGRGCGRGLMLNYLPPPSLFLFCSLSFSVSLSTDIYVSVSLSFSLSLSFTVYVSLPLSFRHTLSLWFIFFWDVISRLNFCFLVLDQCYLLTDSQPQVKPTPSWCTTLGSSPWSTTTARPTVTESTPARPSSPSCATTLSQGLGRGRTFFKSWRTAPTPLSGPHPWLVPHTALWTAPTPIPKPATATTCPSWLTPILTT